MINTLPLKLLGATSSGGYIIVNKKIVQEIGFNEAILLGILASSYEYWYNNDKLNNDMFFVTSEYIEKETTLSYYQQNAALKHLESLDLIKTVKKGIPCKKYFLINEENLSKLLDTTITDNVEIVKNKKSKSSSSSNTNLQADFIDLNGVKIKKSSKSFNNIMKYIDCLSFSDTDKANLKNWVKTIGIGKTSVGQLSNKLKRLSDDCENDITLMSLAIQNSLNNNWLAFYKPNNYQITSTNKKLVKSKSFEDETGRKFDIETDAKRDTDGNIIYY